VRYFQLTAVAVALGIAMGAVVTIAQQHVEKTNMDLVGYDDLQARSAYQPVIQKQGERWIAYVGHHGGTKLNPLTGKQEPNGTSIVDVTNPKQPKYLAHIPGDDAGGGEAGGAQMVRVCAGSANPRADRSKVYLLRSFGTSAHETWDVTDPAKPSRLAVVVSGLRDTHKNWWECDTGIAYLVGGDPAWHTVRMLKIYDLTDPAKPVFVRDFGLPGQQPNAPNPPPMTGHFQDIHGPISTGPAGNRVYIGYGYNGNAVLQIVDRSKLLNGPKEPTDANLLYPQISRLDLRPEDGAHTVLPLLGVPVVGFATQRRASSPAAAAATVEHGGHDESGPPSNPRTMRNYVAVIGEESGGMCSGERQMTRIVDITTESKPGAIAGWTVPDTEELCNRGGRFGPHAANENFTPIYHNRVMFVSYFAGGVRAVDIRDPFNPKEIAYFIPAATSNTSKQCTGRGPDQRCKISIQTNNVEVDDRGYIYTADRADTGMHILELTGAARRVARF